LAKKSKGNMLWEFYRKLSNMRMNEFLIVAYQQFRSMYDSGCQICCRLSSTFWCQKYRNI